MNQSQIAFEKLISHQLTKAGFENGVEVTSKLQVGSITLVEAEFSREPDEYEFYVIEVGHTLAHLLSGCEQMMQAVLFLSAFSPTEKMKTYGITRSSHLQYNIENYLIRTQSIYDRILKLVNAIFHLGIDPRNCRHNTISRNLHVKVTDVPAKLKNLNKLLGKYRQDRNVIIHHESYQEDELRKIEMYHLLLSKQDEDELPDYELLQIVTKNLTREFVKRKIEEFEQFNEAVFLEMASLFDSLESRYQKLQKSLFKKCGS